MAKSPTAYPLAWPPHIPRAKHREKGSFKTELPAALRNVQNALRLFAQDSGKPMSDLVLSSNVTLGDNRPQDPGVAAWFTWDGLTVAIPVDRYDTVAANLQAIFHVVEARRVELRHGTLSLVRATLQGFIALPGAKAPWQVLGVAENASAEQINDAYRKKMVQHHPDKGGSQDEAAALGEARNAMLRLGGGDAG